MRQFVEPLLPEGLALSWFNDPNEAIAMVRDAEVGWLDQFSWNDSADAIFAGEKLKWVNTILAGLDMVPIDYVRQKGIIITNGRGLSSAAVADYAVMGILNLARSEEHTSELQSLMRISYAVFCLKKKKTTKTYKYNKTNTNEKI